MQKIHEAKLRSSRSGRTRVKAPGRSGNLSVLDSPRDAQQRMDRTRREQRGGPDTSKWEIRDFLTFRINVLYRLLDRQLKKLLADHHGLSIAEWRVLGQLATNSPTTVRGIAAITYMAKSQISRAAACLVRSGYAVRRKDFDDERSAVFEITKEGQKKYKTVMRMNRERQRCLLAQLDPTQRRLMFEAVARLIAYVRAEIHRARITKEFISN
jgi:DNA-binding MarR family transcriptional regulator